MYNAKVGGNIQRGDLIAISYGSCFVVGIYYGRGIGGTVQYYELRSPGHGKNTYDNRLSRIGIEKAEPFKLSNIYKSYVSSPRNTRVMKLNRDNITDQEQIEQVLKAKEILQEFNITVNY